MLLLDRPLIAVPRFIRKPGKINTIGHRQWLDEKILSRRMEKR